MYSMLFYKLLNQPIFKRYVPSFLSYILLTLSFPPFHYSFLAFVALVPWIIQLKKIRTPEALKTGAFFGTLFTLTQMIWVKPLVTRFLNNPMIGYGIWIFTAFISILLFYSPLTFCLRKCMKHDRIELIPFIWVSFELIRSYLPVVGFPWGLLATPLSLKPYLIQHASIGTIYFVSLWVAFVNMLFVMLILKTSTRRFAASSFFVTGCLIFSIIRYYDYRPPIAEIKVGLAQMGINFAFTPDNEKKYMINKNTRQLLHQSKDKDLDIIIFPEAMCFGLEYAKKYLFGDHPSTPILFGAHRKDKLDKIYQSCFLYDGKDWQLADKVKLVAMGEYVPMREYLNLSEELDKVLPNMTPGEKVTTFDFKQGIKIGTLICFESNFPYLASTHTSQGATLLVNNVIDDWYIGTPAPEQLFYACIWRSVETGLPLLRVGPLGISGYIDSRGNIKVKEESQEKKLITTNVEVPTRSDANPLRIWIPWFFLASIPYAIIEDIVKFIRKKRKEKKLSQS